MVEYFKLASEELQSKLSQVKSFIKKHNPTIGLLTEEVLKTFLREHLPKSVSVEQGFVMSKNNELSRQCDIIIYDSINYAPLFRINDVIIIPADAVITIIEVKTTINKQILHKTIDYFKNISSITNAKNHLFVYNACKIEKLAEYFISYKHDGKINQLDHDTFELLPDEITGINYSFHLKRDYITYERDSMGYSGYTWKNENNQEISALQNFYFSIVNTINEYQREKQIVEVSLLSEEEVLSNYLAFELFTM